jgi:hypothetical protein
VTNYGSERFDLSWAGTFPGGTIFRVFQRDVLGGAYQEVGDGISGTTTSINASNAIVPAGSHGVERHWWYIVAENGNQTLGQSGVRGLLATY